MSQQWPPDNQGFVPPPPPVSNSPHSPDVIASKTASAGSDARNALIFGIIGLFCFGFIFGFLALRSANQAIETIDTYEVARDKRGLAVAAKVLGIIDIIGWALLMLSRIFLR